MRPGERTVRTAKGPSLACPRCVLPLFVGQAGGVTLHACGRCGGIWLAPACAERLARALPAEALELAGRASASAKAAVDTAPRLVCPACRTPMRRTPVRAAGLELDACAFHGTWYDRHELERVARAVASCGRRAEGASASRGAGVGAVAAGAVAAGAVAAGLTSAEAAGRNASNGRAAQVDLVDAAEIALDAADVAGVATEVAVDAASDVLTHGVLDGAVDLLGGILGSLLDF